METTSLPVSLPGKEPRQTPDSPLSETNQGSPREKEPEELEESLDPPSPNRPLLIFQHVLGFEPSEKKSPSLGPFPLFRFLGQAHSQEAEGKLRGEQQLTATE